MDRVLILPSTLEECQTFDRHGDGHVKCKQTLLPYSCPELRTHCLSSTLQRLDSHSAKTTTANTKTLSFQIGLISVVFVKESQYRFSGLEFANNIAIMFAFAQCEQAFNMHDRFFRTLLRTTFHAIRFPGIFHIEILCLEHMLGPLPLT